MENCLYESEDVRFARLTNGQRDCLRLVGEYLSSKEIARILGISPHTVDQRLKRATALLEVPTRFEAARIYMRHAGPANEPGLEDALYEPLVYQPSGLSDSSHFGNFAPSPGTMDRSGDEASDQLHEYQERYFANALHANGLQNIAQPSLWSVLVGTQRENKLSVQTRVVVMVLIAAFAVMGFAALISVAEGLSRIS